MTLKGLNINLQIMIETGVKEKREKEKMKEEGEKGEEMKEKKSCVLVLIHRKKRWMKKPWKRQIGINNTTPCATNVMYTCSSQSEDIPGYESMVRNT